LTKKKLAKIYYQDREIKDISILFGDEYRSIHTDGQRSIDIGSSVHISGKKEIITMDYVLTEHYDDDKEKEFSECFWMVEDHLDKVQVNHMDSGIMIEWLSNQEVKSSLFIPMVRILHINVDEPLHDDEDHPVKRNEIPR
jgi:hypothetical protein